MPSFELSQREDHVCVSFTAMASPCEILIDGNDPEIVQHIAHMVSAEAWRIETKYSRYRENNIIHQLNHAKGQRIKLDEETHKLLSFAQQCFVLSNGQFDVTAGILNRIWRFVADANPPTQAEIDTLLPLVGWQKLTLTEHSLQMPDDMQIDLGGIGKEYAVDKAVTLCQQTYPELSVLVNFGGDLGVTRPRQEGGFWQVGIEHPDPSQSVPMLVKIAQGGLATSGDARRFLLHKGTRYSHVLNPLTGWAMTDAPRSVTVAGQNCTQAGLLATLALLQGADAKAFLQAQEVTHWILN